MNKKLLRSIVLILLSIALIGCTKEKTNKASNQSSQGSTSQTKSSAVQVRESAQEEIKNTYGITLKTVAVELVGSTYNLQVVMANESNEEKTLDCSKFKIQTYGLDTLKVNGSMKTIKANSSYNQHAFTIEDEGKLKVGNMVYVFYDSTSLGPVEVSEF